MTQPDITLQLPKLNTPDYTHRLRIKQTPSQTTIWDPIRSKWVTLTPEEWIRQNMTLYIADTLQVSTGYMANETEIRYNNLRRRCDSVIYTPQGTPLILIEYKQHRIPITQRTFDQAALYCSHLHVPYLIISNGLQHILCQIDHINHRYIYARQWPTYQALLLQNNTQTP